MKIEKDQNVEVIETGVTDNQDVASVVVVNPNIKEIILEHPRDINGVLFTCIKLDFTNMTGEDVLKVDEELRLEGHNLGFSSIYDQRVLLKLAARASKMIPEDLKKLHVADYMEVVFSTRNFFI